MDASKSILILGGGVGGLVTAVALRKRLSKGHRVVLVDRQENHVFAPSFLWLMTGERTARQISRPLARLERKDIEVVRGEIQRIEPESRTVTVDSKAFSADFLVVALGADLAPDAIPGLSEAGHNVYTLAGAESLRDALTSFEQGRLIVLTAAPAYKCPAAPYEAAMLLADHFRKRKIRDRIKIDLYAAEPTPMGVAGPTVSAGVRQAIEERGIAYHPEHQIQRIDAAKQVAEFKNGARAEFDLLAYVPPHRAPQVVREAGMTADSGWIAVDKHTFETRFSGVYAIGDVTAVPLSLGKPLPKAGVFAHGEAEVVSRNIARAITGRGGAARFEGAGECFLETGDGKAAFGSGNFYAEPLPQVKLHKPARRWHWAKILFEKQWLGKLS